MADDNAQLEALERMVLGYLLKHPAAADRLEGVRLWWLGSAAVSQRDLQIVLDRMSEKGLLLTRGTEPELRIYSLNEGARDGAFRSLRERADG